MTGVQFQAWARNFFIPIYDGAILPKMSGIMVEPGPAESARQQAGADCFVSATNVSC